MRQANSQPSRPTIGPVVRERRDRCREVELPTRIKGNMAQPVLRVASLTVLYWIVIGSRKQVRTATSVMADRAVNAQEQIANGPAAPIGDPPLRAVVRPVVQHVAALAERPPVPPLVVGGVAVEVRGGEHDAGGAQPGRLDQVGQRAARPRQSRQVLSTSSNQRPSGRQGSRTRCGRPRLWHLSFAARTARAGSARASAGDRAASARDGSALTKIRRRRGRGTVRRCGRSRRAPASTCAATLRAF